MAVVRFHIRDLRAKQAIQRKAAGLAIAERANLIMISRCAAYHEWYTYGTLGHHRGPNHLETELESVKRLIKSEELENLPSNAGR